MQDRALTVRGRGYVRKPLGRNVENPAASATPRAEHAMVGPTAQSPSIFRVAAREPDTPLTSALPMGLGGFLIFAEGFVGSVSRLLFGSKPCSCLRGSPGLGVAEIALGGLATASPSPCTSSHGPIVWTER